MKIKKNKSTPKVALALGGGGARGYTYIGALRAFQEEGIDFDICVGTSVGSLIGAVYASGASLASIEDAAERLELTDVHSPLLIKPDNPLKIGEVLRTVIGDALIEDLPKPFAAVATDLITAKQVILDKGSAAMAVSASSAVPLVYSPLSYNGMHLVDGGLVNNVPSDVCKMLGADKVVAIDINPTRAMGASGTGLLDVLKTVFHIMNANASVMGKIHADVFIPIDTSSFSSTSKSGYSDMIEIGYDAVKSKSDEIKQLFV